MPSSQYFRRFPPFPGEVETFELSEISYSKLQSNDPAESFRLFQACRQSGFFRLNLGDSPDGILILKNVEELFTISEQLYDSPEQQLDRYPYKPPQDLHGYKCVGNTRIEDGSPDNIEMYNFTRDSITNVGPPRRNPPLLDSRKAIFQSFIQKAHPVIEVVMQHLEDHLKLERGALTGLNVLHQPSSSAVRLLKASHTSPESRTNLLGHTDIGVITMLFNVIGGLQILPPGSLDREDKSWKHVKPKPGCALMNLADAMVEWSGGLLRSNLHRVVTPPGQQWSSDRHSIAYQVRATSTASMGPLKSSVIPNVATTSALTAAEWETMRAVSIKQGKGLPESRGGEIGAT